MENIKRYIKIIENNENNGNQSNNTSQAKPKPKTQERYKLPTAKNGK